MTHRNHNHSAFNGYHKTYSDYSQVICIECSTSWRTKAAWVLTCPDLKKGEEQRYPDNEVCL